MIGRLLQPENPRHKLHTSSRLPYLPLIPTRCSFQMGSIFWRENVLLAKLSGKSFLKTEGKTKQEEGKTNREEESKEMKSRPSRQVRPGKKISS